MGFSNFVTDKVDFFTNEGTCIYKDVSIQLNSDGNVNMEGLSKEIKKGNFFIRKVNDTIKEKYIIKQVDYQNHRNTFFRMTKLKVQKEGDEGNKESYISGGTHIHAGGDIIIGDNNKNTINEIEKLIDLINKGSIDNKDEIKELLEEFKKTKDKSKLVDAFSILGSGASVNSMIIALSSLIV